MKSPQIRILFVLATLLLATLACGGSFSTANIASAQLTTDPESGTETTVFAPDQVFYCIVKLKNAPDDTQVKAVWTAVQAEGLDPNYYLAETVLTGGDGTLTFELSNDYLWPAGTYKVDLYLNGNLDRTLEFMVQ